MPKKIIWSDNKDTFREEIVKRLEERLKEARIGVEIHQTSYEEELLMQLSLENYFLVITGSKLQKSKIDPDTIVEGIDVIRKIKNDYKKVPIIIVTSNKGAGEEAVNEGASNYVSKLSPDHEEDIYNLVMQCLSN